MNVQTGPSPYILNLTVNDLLAHVSQPQSLLSVRILSFVLQAGNTLDGAWKIEISHDYALDKDVSMGQNVNPGLWVDVTALFKTAAGAAIAAVSHLTGSTQVQWASAAPLGGKWYRVTFTATAGTGPVTVAPAGGDYTK